MQLRHFTVILPVALLLGGLAGCEVGVEPARVAVRPVDEVYVGPGYYYDDEYYDAYGHYHPRAYWYHDDHGWAHRDGIPHGYEARSRSSVGYGHGGGPHADAGHGGGPEQGAHDGGGGRR